jgi:[pyruvate, water dikinase]-phosphate phosphotransferase / [pyruvate, water dikinase] kinase
VGLSITAQRLHRIREERRPGTVYASVFQCQKECQDIHSLFDAEKLPFISSTSLSIEELATKILMITGIKRQAL